ncbi:DNA primase [Breznakia pachnodae]|uniref:DNA primase n=1 Tax=Breznakia pachnodae TaxID=265178 RepID=A0ABU0E6J7_9FIRM|nr:DNA primase [Breznakia pachnodae]MDQ0362538.1 DNA primase [Breznakia pachnodae]
MAFIPEEKIQEILKSVNIVDVIGERLTLTKHGNNYLCTCPWHDDSKPSLTVNQDKQIYKCFVCGEGGNAIRFVMNYDNITFPKACKKLAEVGGVELNLPDQKYTVKEVPAEIKRIYELNEAIVELANYEILLNNGNPSYAYITPRLDNGAITNAKIGYIPSVDNLRTYLLQKGFLDDEIKRANIFNEKGSYSFLEKRLIFPIKDNSGNYVGFSTRSLDGKGAKYINSPESAVFKKNEILYNYKDAFQDIKRLGRVILMEGYMDVQKAESVSIKNAVCSMGTALTKQQVLAIKRLNVPVSLCCDGDKAGIDANIRNYYLLKENGINASFASLPTGMDPDEVISKDVDQFKQILGKHDTIIDFRLKVSDALHTFDEKQAFTLEVLNDLAKMDNPLAEDHYISEIGEKTGFEKETLKKQLSVVKGHSGPKKVVAQKRVRNSSTKWSENKKVYINFRVKDKLNYRNEVMNMYDKKYVNGSVMAFNDRKVLTRKDILMQYSYQKGKVLETTITLPNEKNAAAKAQNIVSAAARQISDEMNIPHSNLNYIAYLHSDSEHPKIHVHFYQNETYLDNYDLTSNLVNNLQKTIVDSLDTGIAIQDTIATPIGL